MRCNIFFARNLPGTLKLLVSSFLSFLFFVCFTPAKQASSWDAFEGHLLSRISFKTGPQKKGSKHRDETHVSSRSTFLCMKNQYMLDMFVAVAQGLKLDALAQHIVITY